MSGPHLCRRHGHHHCHCLFKGVPVVMLLLNQDLATPAWSPRPPRSSKGKGSFSPSCLLPLLISCCCFEKSHWASGISGQGRSRFYRYAPPTEILNQIPAITALFQMGACAQRGSSHAGVWDAPRSPCFCSGAEVRGLRLVSMPCTRASEWALRAPKRGLEMRLDCLKAG